MHEESSATKSRDYVDGKDPNASIAPTSSEPPAQDKGEKANRARKTSRSPEPFDHAEREEMERLLQELRGHLGMSVLFLDA